MKENFNMGLPKTPMKDILDSGTQKYIDGRFPETNDDSLQEDLAVKFITDSGFLDKLEEEHGLSERIQQNIDNEMWKLYEKKLKLGLYLDIHKDLNKRVAGLLDDLRAAELRSEMKGTFKLEKSNKSEEELNDFYKEQINEIKVELSNIKNEEISSANVGQIFDQYTKAVNDYNNFYKILYETKNLELN